MKKNYLDNFILLSLGLTVISSQWSVAASSIGLGITVIFFFLKLIYDKEFKIKEEFFWLFGLLIIAQIISTLIAEDFSQSLRNISRRIPIYTVFFASLAVMRDTKKIQMFLSAFFLFTGIICIIEITRFIIDFNSLHQLSEYRLQYYGYPVTNGAIKMLILITLIPLILSKEKFMLNKYVLMIISVLLVITIYLTNARSAFLGLFSGLLLYGLIENRRFVIYIITIIAIFLLLAPREYKERILSIADLQHPSNHSRIIMWETGLRIISDSPLFGYGDVDIKKLYSRYKEPEFHGEGSHMHNNALQIAVNFGLLGLMAWLALMAYIISRQIKIIGIVRDDRFLRALSVISLCSMIATQISGLAEWNFGDAEFSVVMWFTFSLAFISEYIYAKRHSHNI